MAAAETATKRIDEYVGRLPRDQARSLQSLRATIKSAAPDASEAISYSMPAFKLGNRVLVYYAAFKDHLSLFPASRSVMDKLGPELQDHFSGKGTLRFTPDEPLPDELVRRIVAVRRDEIGAV